MSSSEGLRDTEGTASCTATSKKGLSRKRTPLPAREQTLAFSACSDLDVQFRSAWKKRLLYCAEGEGG